MKTFQILLLFVCLFPAFAIAGENEWTYVGLYPEYITDIVVHPNNPDILYASAIDTYYDSTREGGIFKTTDHGLTWDTVGFRHMWPQALAFDPQHPETLWAAVHIASTWRSTNGGETWENRSEGLYLGNPDNYGAIDIAVSPFDSDLLLCCGGSDTWDGWLYRTTNGGELWTEIDNIPAYKVVFDTLSLGRVFVLDFVYGTIWISDDSGMTFQRISQEETWVDFTLDPFRLNWLWIIGLYDFLYSQDAGSTWIEPDNTFPPAGHRVLFVRVSPERINTVYATTLGRVFQTEDGGLNWDEFTEGWPTQSRTINTMSVVASSPTELWAGLTYHGILTYTVVDTSSIIESSGPEAQKISLSIYPNPASNILYLNISTGPFSGTFSLYNVLGQSVFSIPISRLNGVRAITLPDALPSGTYFGSCIPQVRRADIPMKAYPVVIVK